MKLEFSGQIFKKYSNIKCHENPHNVSRTVACGRTDGHEAKSRVSEFYERASKQRNVTDPLTRKSTGLLEVLDARQTEHRLTLNSKHTSSTCLPHVSHHPTIRTALYASQHPWSFLHAGIPPIFFLRNAVKHATRLLTSSDGLLTNCRRKC